MSTLLSRSRSSRGVPLPRAILAVAFLGLIAFLGSATPAASAALPTVTIQNASEVGYLTAQAEGSVDPEGAEPTTYRLQYATQADFSDALTAKEETIEGAKQTVKAELTNLTQNTAYYLRLLAENASNPEAPAEAVASETFTTKEVQKPELTIAEASPVTATSAHASGTVQLANVDPAFNSSCEFQYATEADFSNATAVACEPETILAAEAQPVAVKADLSGLVPGATYHLRLAATNSGGSAEAVAPDTFTTEALPPSVDATFATAVSETEATLGAKVNPGGAATTVHFEYLSAEQFKKDGEQFGAGTVETEPAQAGSHFPTQLNCTEKEEQLGCIPDATASQSVGGLAPNTAYRFRAVATNAQSPSGTPGPIKAFTTAAAPTEFTGKCPANEQPRRENNSTALPDCRAYEQVSPVDKGGNPAYTQGNTPAQTTADGEKIAYLSYTAFPGAQGNTAIFSGHLGTRATGGWQTTELTPAGPTAPHLRNYQVDYAFSEDLATIALRVPPIGLTPDSAPNAFELVVRHPGGAYTLINSAEPAVSVEAQCPPGELGNCFEFIDVSTFAGASADFSHVLFESNAQLEPQAPLTGIESLYENDAGTLRLVGVLPDGAPAATSTAGAGSAINYSSGSQQIDGRLENAISRDGSRVLFQAPADEGTPAEVGQAGMTEVYARIDGSETIEVSAPAPGATPANTTPQPATFQAASKDGSRVFFTGAAELTTLSNTGAENNGSDLYEYNLDTATLTDLSLDTNPADAATGPMVQGVVDTSSDGSYVYFVALGQLLPGQGAPGEPNLYLTHEGHLTYLTTLSGSGACSFGALASADACDYTPFPPQLEAYATPDGGHLAFMSTRSLATVNFPQGYDNTDRFTGLPDSQVYEYTAPSPAQEAHDEAGELICASCDPSGALPQGNSLIGGIAQTRLPRKPTQHPYNGLSTPFYQVRAMNDSGTRLFYTTPGPDGNPISQVREYEQGGEGSCTNPAGCQYLLSDPAGAQADRFLGASADGRDVFLATSSRLIPTDTDNVRDVYDVRAAGGFAVPLAPPLCEGEGCRGQSSNPPAGSSPATPAFAGREEGPKHPKCSKRQVRRRGRCQSKRHRPKKPQKAHHKRAAKANRGGSK